jgi:hypothetical protein
MKAGPFEPGRPTADRLTAALHARTATLGEDTLTTRAPGYPTGPAGYAPREPLLPKWGWAVAAVALVASIVAGAVLGVRADSSKPPLPVTALAPKTQALGSGVTAQAKLTLLAVRGKTIRLEADLKNLAPAGSNDSWSIGSKLGAGTGNYDVSGITLTVDGLKVSPLQDADEDCECSSTSSSLEPQETNSVFAVYPAPKTLPKTVDVFIPGFGSWLDVPVSG